jgi:hypothetical protein
MLLFFASSWVFYNTLPYWCACPKDRGTEILLNIVVYLLTQRNVQTDLSRMLLLLKRVCQTFLIKLR